MKAVDRARRLVQHTSQVLAEHKKKGHLLDQIAWPRDVEERFLHSVEAGRNELPAVEYSVDRDGLEAHIRELDEAAGAVDGDDAISEWLRRVILSRNRCRPPAPCRRHPSVQRAFPRESTVARARPFSLERQRTSTSPTTSSGGSRSTAGTRPPTRRRLPCPPSNSGRPS